jgi:hypothetical protein
MCDRITQAVVRALKALGVHAVLGYIDAFWFFAPIKEEWRVAYDCDPMFLADLGAVVVPFLL